MASVNISQVSNGKLLSTSDSFLQASWISDHDRDLFQLIQKLQSSLSISFILQTFYQSAVELLAIGHMSYISPDNQEHLFGSACRHNLFYNLKIDDKELGALKFTRDGKFTSNDQKTLENLICLLVYPLRNAHQYEQAIRAAVIDPLTGVCNRATMNEIMLRELDSSQRHDTALSILMIDIDNFKQINDSHGHATGDEVIRLLANSLKCAARGSDYIFRYGGEEFTMLLNNTDIDGAERLAERLRFAVAGLCSRIHGHDIAFTVSIGITSRKQNDSVERMFNRADKALYVAKHSGKNCVKSLPGLVA